MKTAVYPGSFDPITTGHYDIVSRAAKLFDEVIVLIMQNVEKTGMFMYHERQEFCERAFAHLDNVKVDVSRGLVADYCKANDYHYLIKGLRNSKDFLYELPMARFNHALNPDIETYFLPASETQSWVSSSAVRELISYDADISPYVPYPVADMIQKLREDVNEI